MKEATKEEMIEMLKDWRGRLIDENRASESEDFWNEEENGDETFYQAIRRLIESQSEVDEEFIEKWIKQLIHPFYEMFYIWDGTKKDYYLRKFKQMFKEIPVRIKEDS
jgi:hypothetical protein